MLKIPQFLNMNEPDRIRLAAHAGRRNGGPEFRLRQEQDGACCGSAVRLGVNQGDRDRG